MLALAGWFVIGAIPVGGAVSPWSGWVFPGLGMVMLVLLVLLGADTARQRWSFSRAAARSESGLGAAKESAFLGSRCARASAL
jgi:hypothetical protein